MAIRKTRSKDSSLSEKANQALDRIVARYEGTDATRLLQYLAEKQKAERITEQIREAIGSSELSRYEIAKQSGVDQATLSRFVSGERSITLETAEKLCPVLGLELLVRRRKKTSRRQR